MNTKIIALACIFVAPLASSQEADGPAELRSARAAYLHQTKTATDPIRLQYLRTLESLKKTTGARGDVRGAVAIQKEIDSLSVAPPNDVSSVAKRIGDTEWASEPGSHTFTLNANGALKSNVGGKGKWSLVSPTELTLQWDGNAKESWALNITAGTLKRAGNVYTRKN